MEIISLSIIGFTSIVLFLMWIVIDEYKHLIPKNNFIIFVYILFRISHVVITAYFGWLIAEYLKHH